MTGCAGNSIPTIIALGFASGNSWYLRGNKLAITLITSQYVYTIVLQVNSIEMTYS